MAGVLGLPYIAQSDTPAFPCGALKRIFSQMCNALCTALNTEVAFTPRKECDFECSGISERREMVEVLCIHYITVKSFLPLVVSQNSVYSEEEVAWI